VLKSIKFLFSPTTRLFDRPKGFLISILKKQILSPIKPSSRQVWRDRRLCFVKVKGMLNFVSLNHIKNLKMKKLFVFILLTFNLVAAQAQNDKLEILLIGAAHNYPSPQDMTDVHRKIQAFKPDAIFGEFLSPEDEKAAVDYWNKENVNDRSKRLSGKRPISEDKLPSVIADLKAKVAQNPKDFKLKVDLAHAFYLALDAGNAHFQMWQVSKEMKKDTNNKALFEYAKLVLHPSVTSATEFVKRFSQSEYDLIAYPMLLALGHSGIYPMDYQAFDPFWSEAWGMSDSLQTLYETAVLKDKTSVDALMYMAIKQKQEDMNQKAKTDIDGYPDNKSTEQLNTPFIDEYYHRGNIVSPEFLSLRGFPAHAFQDKLHWWMMRNIMMCKNTINRSKANGFKKVVIVVGAGHRFPMATLFSQMEGVKVWNLNAYDGK
jgi:Family of unknown function (DUF5694)